MSQHNIIVLHKIDKQVIGILNDGSVEWWNSVTDICVLYAWAIYERTDQLLHYDNRRLKPKFKSRCLQLKCTNITPIYNENDSLLIQKIKELDYKWELHMKQKGNFYLTSRALNVDQETTLQPTVTDTATVSGVTSINLPSNTYRHCRILIDDFDF